jgi:hypothetical protein
MKITVFLTLVGIIAGCGARGDRPLEEVCEPLRAKWKEAIRKEVLTEMHLDDPEPAEKRKPAANSITPREIAMIKAVKDKAQNKRIDGNAPPEQPEIIPESSQRTPGKLTLSDKAALADDPATKKSVIESKIPVSAKDDAAQAVRKAGPPTPSAPGGSDTARPAKSPKPAGDNAATPGPLKVLETTISSGVEQRKPVGKSNHFKALPSRFFCYTVVKNSGVPTTVTHVWRQGKKVHSRVKLNVGTSPSWRTWSRQRPGVKPKGNWSCEILNESGDSLGIARFKVGKS